MRGKLQIEWDLTFNSMDKYICILIKIYLVSISAIHKNSISNQMDVVDGRANRVTRHVTKTCTNDSFHRELSFDTLQGLL